MLSEVNICDTEIYDLFIFIRQFNQILKLTYKKETLPNLKRQLVEEKDKLNEVTKDIAHKIDCSSIIKRVEDRISKGEQLKKDMQIVESMQDEQFSKFIELLS